MNKALRSIAFLFIVVCLIIVIAFKWLASAGLDPVVLLSGNLIVFLLTMSSFYLIKRGLGSTSTSGFLSSVYSSFIMKLVIAGLVVFIYVKLSGEQMNVPAVLASMFLYLLYTFIEVKGLLLLVKKD
ncbi:MAG: hypothetical protein ACK5AO_01175 [bacterium]|jgi:hypothetical protein